jgi:hypothetical protein
MCYVVVVMMLVVMLMIMMVVFVILTGLVLIISIQNIVQFLEISLSGNMLRK